ncbi:alpha/beta hydrolase [Suttonella ornithocola]|uniref:Phospholipase ytpA n=1 Tax=Suttonella ornithocola TaxID=279832 RepID=A0A380MX34_9GAMM|nr:alpha/beta hydrolase [Suttonella ornithocola]SUO96848.1 Phospholipase ytpA [Suttonella ornithocola]
MKKAEFWQHPDGHNIHYNWLPTSSARANLILVHGIGEHIGRYCNDIPHFHDLRLNVLSYDQYGHGQTSGTRGGLDCDNRLDKDLEWIINKSNDLFPSELPKIIFGHSMGGAVVANRLAHSTQGLNAAILSSPALKPHGGKLSRWLAFGMAKLAPDLIVKHKLSMKVSHLPSVNQQLKNDPLCHKKISARLGKFIFTCGDNAKAASADWSIPTLLLYAGSDYLVDPKGSQYFAQQISPKILQAKCFQNYYHEIFHEQNTKPVYEALSDWLDSILGKN